MAHTRHLLRRSAAAATAVVAVAALAAATRNDDDPDPPEISIEGVIGWELPVDHLVPEVTITLSRPVDVPVTVWLMTFDGTATAPEDYTAIDELVTVEAGEVSQGVPVEIHPDRLREPEEHFKAVISAPSQGRIRTGSAEVTILDGAPPRG